MNIRHTAIAIIAGAALISSAAAIAKASYETYILSEID